MYTEMRVIMGDNNWSYSKIYKEIKKIKEEEKIEEEKIKINCLRVL